MIRFDYYVKIAIFAILLSLPVINLQSKDNPKNQFGVYAGGNLLYQDASFSKLPGLQSCCYEFNEGNGAGFELGVLYYMPISASSVFQMKAGYAVYMNNFNKTEVIGNAYDYNYNTIDAVSDFNLDITLGLIKINPSYILKLTSALSLNLGAEAGYVISSSYENSEVLIEPSFAQFIDGSKSRNTSGSIEVTAFPFLAAKAGLGYDLKLSKGLVLAPEAGINYNLLDLAKDSKWKVHSFPYFNLNLRFVPIGPQPVPPMEPPPLTLPNPPVPPEQPAIDVEINAYYIADGAMESDLEIIQIQEFLTRRIHPLLNYVFFAENSADILPRYNIIDKSEISGFSSEKFYGRNTLDVYHDILNIIGSRMKKNPKAQITLTGCNANENKELSNITLSRKRAETIKKYLENVWGIEKNRLKIEARNLPRQQSNSAEIDGREENRRVEIASDFEEIFEPMTIIDTIVKTIPPVLKFRVQSKTKAVIKEWSVSAYQRDKKLKEFSGSGNLPDNLEWIMANDKEYIPLFNQPVYYKIGVTDIENRKWESAPRKLEMEPLTAKNKFLAIEKGVDVKDKEIDEFSLMSFAYNSPELNKGHMLLLGLAREKIDGSSYVLIKGYTDRVGEEQHNMQLSLNRALATAAALNIDPKFVSGVGETEPLFDNNLPEGRFYNRAVYITIENPVEK